MRSSKTPIAIAFLLALCLAGCGGGGGASTSSGATSEPSSSAPHEPEPRLANKRRSLAELPEPAPGEEVAAPGVPTSEHGDNSIQTWGLEASRAERLRAGAAVESFLRARAAGDWGRACALLAAKLRAEQRQLAQGASCARAVAAFTPRGPAPAEEARIQVLSLRVGAGRAFLIYRRRDGEVYAMALLRERGSWRLDLITPASLGMARAARPGTAPPSTSADKTARRGRCVECG